MANLTLKGLTAVLVASTCLASAPALASPTPWVHPGQHPYEGTPYEAAVLHEKTTGLPAVDYMRGVAMFNAGQCEEHYLQDEEVLQNTFTKAGQTRSVSTVVRFRDQKTGRPLAANDPKRRSMRCRIPGRTDGATVVFPFVCANWSLQYLPALPQKVVIIQREIGIDFSMPTGRKEVIETEGVFSPGVFIDCPDDCCPPIDIRPSYNSGTRIEVMRHNNGW